MNEMQTPLPIVRQWGNLIPGVWDKMASAADARRNGKDSAAAEDADLVAALDVLGAVVLPDASPVEVAHGIYSLACASVWRKHKIVYAFDDALAASLAAQADAWTDSADLPLDILRHLPYECCFVSAPDILADGCTGFFPFFVRRMVDPAPAFGLCCVYSDGNACAAHTYLVQLHGKTIGDCVQATTRAARAVPHDADAQVNIDERLLRRAINLLLYLSADNAEIDNKPAATYRPRTSNAPIRDKFREVQALPVGIVIGAALRRSAAASAPSGAPRSSGVRHVRAHTRRGHWHHFWTGKRSSPDDRKIVLKWVAPTFVGGKDAPEVTTIHPVK